jgi:hypothetical protein
MIPDSLDYNDDYYDRTCTDGHGRCRECAENYVKEEITNAA